MKHFGGVIALLTIAMVTVLGCSTTYAKKVEVVSAGMWPPFKWIDNGELVGYAIEVTREMIQRAGYTGVFKTMPSKRIKRIAHTPNLIQPSLARTLDRESSYHWIGPIYPRVFSTYALTERTDVRPKNFQEATKFSIAELWDTPGFERMKDIGFKKVIGFRDFESAMIRFLRGEADLIRLLEAEFCYFSRKLTTGSQNITKLFSEDTKLHYYIVLHKKSDPDLVLALSKAFEDMKSDGTLENLQRKYNNCNVLK